MIRSDFVSNSSSSSFIVVSDSEAGHKNGSDNTLDTTDKVITLPDKSLGRTTFGRSNECFYSIGSKLNFAAMQLIDLYDYVSHKDDPEWKAYIDEGVLNRYIGKFDNYLKMFERVCERLGFTVVLNYNYLKDDLGTYDYFIDHQSSVCEGENMGIFNDEETLYNFLHNQMSYIHMLSDECEEDMMELDEARKKGIICLEKTS